MACTLLLLFDPLLGRALSVAVPGLPEAWGYQAITFGLDALVIIGLVLTLPAAARAGAAFAAFAAVDLTVLALWFWLPHLPPWTAIASWFRRLPLT